MNGKKENHMDDQSDLTSILGPLHDYPNWVTEISVIAKPFTMTSENALAGMIFASRYIDAARIPGDIVECGVWKGGSLIASELASTKKIYREYWYFDTFEGMDPPTESDNMAAHRAYDLGSKDGDSEGWLAASLEEVRANAVQAGCDLDQCHFVKGRVEDTLFSIIQNLPKKIAILRLDTDWYSSTKAALEVLFDRVVANGVVIFDDYGFWQGAKKAVDEFLSERDIAPLLIPLDRTAMIMQKIIN
jgi:O-methyltransferase